MFLLKTVLFPYPKKCVLTVGSFASLLAINLIVGIGSDPAGKIHLFDGEKLSWRQIGIPADPGCTTCGSA